MDTVFIWPNDGNLYFSTLHRIIKFEVDSTLKPYTTWYSDYLLLEKPTVLIENEKNSSTPESYSLSQNYPNPFNPSTTIHYELPTESNVKIAIYDMLGRKIHELISQKQHAGNHSVQWNGIDSQGNKVSAGIYLYQIQAGDFVQTKKMLLLR